MNIDLLFLIVKYGLLASFLFSTFYLQPLILKDESSQIERKKNYLVFVLNFILLLFLGQLLFVIFQFNQNIILTLFSIISALPIIYFYIFNNKNNLQKLQIFILSIIQFIILYVLKTEILIQKIKLSTTIEWLMIFLFALVIFLFNLLLFFIINKLSKNQSLLKIIRFLSITSSIALGFHLSEDILGPFPSSNLISNYTIIGLFIITVFYFVIEPVKNVTKNKKTVFIIQHILFTFIFSFGLFLVTSSLRIEKKKIHYHKINGLAWATSIHEAKAIAKEKQSIILVDFWATWCISCKRMEMELFHSEKFKNLVKKYNITLARIDMTEPNLEKKELAQKYQVRGLPTITIINSKGDLLEKQVGYSGFQSMIYSFERIFYQYTKKD